MVHYVKHCVIIAASEKTWLLGFHRLLELGENSNSSLLVGFQQGGGYWQMKRLHCLPRRHWTNRMRSSGPQPVLLWWWWRPSLDYSWLSFHQHLTSTTPAISLWIYDDVSFFFSWSFISRTLYTHCTHTKKKSLQKVKVFYSLLCLWTWATHYSLVLYIENLNLTSLFWTELFNYICFLVWGYILLWTVDMW